MAGLLEGQIKAAMGDGATAGEVAEALGVTAAEVAVVTGGTVGMTADEKAAVRAELEQNLIALARYSDNDSVRVKASIYMVDELAGRHDADKAGLGGLATRDIAMLNDQLRRARELAFAGAFDVTPIDP